MCVMVVFDQCDLGIWYWWYFDDLLRTREGFRGSEFSYRQVAVSGLLPAVLVPGKSEPCSARSRLCVYGAAVFGCPLCATGRAVFGSSVSLCVWDSRVRLSTLCDRFPRREA